MRFALKYIYKILNFIKFVMLQFIFRFQMQLSNIRLLFNRIQDY